MRSRLSYAIAALFAAGAVSFAGAQEPAPNFVAGPVASTLKTDGGDADRANAIAQPLNAAPALRNSKITVQSDGDNVLLTGAALTQDQAQLATAIANGQAGKAKVVNVIQADHITYKRLDQMVADTEETAPAQAGAAEQQASEEEVEPVVNQFGQPVKS